MQPSEVEGQGRRAGWSAQWRLMAANRRGGGRFGAAESNGGKHHGQGSIRAGWAAKEVQRKSRQRGGLQREATQSGRNRSCKLRFSFGRGGVLKGDLFALHLSPTDNISQRCLHLDNTEEAAFSSHDHVRQANTVTLWPSLSCEFLILLAETLRASRGESWHEPLKCAGRAELFQPQIKLTFPLNLARSNSHTTTVAKTHPVLPPHPRRLYIPATVY